VLSFAFSELKLDAVYSFASLVNARSISVMEKIGMINSNQNFNHPIVPAGHTLSEHVLYKFAQLQNILDLNERANPMRQI
jgi:RimJ/RimL family protein N-acetyltransferase